MNALPSAQTVEFSCTVSAVKMGLVSSVQKRLNPHEVLMIAPNCTMQCAFLLLVALS